MAAVAEFYKLDKSRIPELRESARRRRRLFRSAEDRYFSFLEESAERLKSYDWSGYVYATLLPYLDERNITLMSSEFDDLGAELTELRESTHFILTAEHKNNHLAELDSALFNKEELAKYFEEFNGETWPDAGDAMLNAISVLRDNLEQVDDGSIVIFAIF